ncbi:MAG TPA: Gfo/Idh/MocA family oxidoreductase [Phycisphaerae bacterium]|nr:Gfo/Idh/MocA family oxidoreductase [Phycisphaerae bacterium]
MAADGKVRVAVAGLRFGGYFAGMFAAHPNVERVGLCDTDTPVLDRAVERIGGRRHGSLQEILDDDYDAVALFTPIPDHAAHSIAVLRAGKHCACAVPMAATLDDLRAVLAAQRETGRNYMMMETSVANEEFLFVRDMHQRGEFGRIQFLRGMFHHDLENHPRYWMGLPPMHYITHPMSPILALAGTSAERVCCFGSGAMRPELHETYGNPYPVETAVFRLRNSDIAAQITSMIFHTAIDFRETFDLYGEKQSFQWATHRVGDKHSLIRKLPTRPGGQRGTSMLVQRIDSLPSLADHLPESMRARHVAPGVLLVDEFVRSILESRQPWIDAPTAANWSAPGLCAHLSAMRGGEPVDIPLFE